MQIKNSPLSLSPSTIRAVLLGLIATTVAAGGTWITLELSNDSLRIEDIPQSRAMDKKMELAVARHGTAVPPRASASQMTNWSSQTQPMRLTYQPPPTRLAPTNFNESRRLVRESASHNDHDRFTQFETASPAPLARAPMVLEVSPGVRLPAILMEADEALSPQAAVIKERIAEEFAREIRDAADPEKSENPSKPEVATDAFDPAVRRADERYRMFFGDAAYNQRTMQAAKQAVRTSKE